MERSFKQIVLRKWNHSKPFKAFYLARENEKL